MTMTRKQFLAAVRLCKEVAAQKGLKLMTRNHHKAPVGYKKGALSGGETTPPVNKAHQVKPHRYRPSALGDLVQQSGGRSTPVTKHTIPSDKDPSKVPVRKTSRIPMVEGSKRPNPKLTGLPSVQVSRPVKPTGPPVTATEVVPEPCQTCGRSDLPERFHHTPYKLQSYFQTGQCQQQQ